MLKYTRHEQILEYLKEKKAVDFSKLSSKFNVSISTIRRDLLALSEDHPIKFTHGGVFYPIEEAMIDKQIYESNDNEFIKIGKKAVTLINDGDSLILDAGRTTSQLAMSIRKSNLKNLTIITTSIAIANILQPKNLSINIIVIGGEYRDDYRCFTGAIAEEALKNIFVNKAFLGTTGISQNGFYTPFLSEASLRKKICTCSEERILLLDETKFGNKSGFIVNSLSSINKIITNDVPSNWLQILKEYNIEIITA